MPRTRTCSTAVVFGPSLPTAGPGKPSKAIDDLPTPVAPDDKAGFAAVEPGYDS